MRAHQAVQTSMDLKSLFTSLRGRMEQPDIQRCVFDVHESNIIVLETLMQAWNCFHGTAICDSEMS